MTYTDSCLLISAALYVLCVTITTIVLRDAIEDRRLARRNWNPWAVAVMASAPWVVSVPAMLALLGIVGP